MKRTLLPLIVAAVCGAALLAQSVPEINYDANADVLSLPSYGEVAGVATNSRGQVFVTEGAEKQGRDTPLFLAHLDELRSRLRRYRKVHVICDSARCHTSWMRSSSMTTRAPSSISPTGSARPTPMACSCCIVGGSSTSATRTA